MGKLFFFLFLILFLSNFCVAEEYEPTLIVSKGKNSPKDHVLNKTNFDENYMLQLNFTAKNDSIRVSSIYLIAYGTGDDAIGINYVAACLDKNWNNECEFGEDIVGVGRYRKDNGILTLSLKDFIIPINSSKILSFYYKMNNISKNIEKENYTFEVSIIEAYGTSSGKTAKVTGLPIKSAVKTIYYELQTTTSTTTQTSTTSTLPITTTTKGTKISEEKGDFSLILMGSAIFMIVIIFYFLMRTQAQKPKVLNLPQEIFN